MGCALGASTFLGSVIVVGSHEIIPGYARVGEYCAQGRAFDPWVVGHRQRGPCSVGIFPHHGKVIAFSDQVESQVLESLHDLPDGSVYGQSAGHTATPVSATKASRTESSLSKTSFPKVSM